jgi:hypothetical protein
VLIEPIDDGPEDARVAGEQVEARVVGGLLASPRRENDHLRVPHRRILDGPAGYPSYQELPVHQVHGFPLGTSVILVEKKNFAGQSLIEECIGGRRPHVSGPDDANSPTLNHRGGGRCELGSG